jgi:hypothetical protein
MSNFGTEWIEQHFIIACRGDLLRQVQEIDVWEILRTHPEFYFAEEGEVLPSMVILNHIEVSVRGEIAFDIRNLLTTRGWSYQLDGDIPIDIPLGTNFITNIGRPKVVRFLYGSNEHTTFRLFYEG